MKIRREKAPAKKMRRIALIICEGESEVQYINLLKKWYKSPVRIVSHIEGTKITQALVENRTKELKISQWDHVTAFLMYDMYITSVTEFLLRCRAEYLLSNPCFEIWLLLHAKDQKTALSTNAVIHELKKSSNVWTNYKKSSYTETQKEFLKVHTKTAIDRAQKLTEFDNPSSGIYKLLQVVNDKYL